jgi:uncharacterized protein (DUF1697 family)
MANGRSQSTAERRWGHDFHPSRIGGHHLFVETIKSCYHSRMSQIIPEEHQIRYVAFLRGINVGGHNLLRMDELKKAFASLGFGNVRTITASGNVVFEAPPDEPGALARKIEKNLEKKFGCEIGVIVRTADELRGMVAADPFQKMRMTADVKLYVTFQAEKAIGDPKIPHQSPNGDFCVLKVSGGEIFSMVNIAKGGRTLDAMKYIEKKFGGSVTTRNWSTIKKIAEMISLRN